MNKRILLVMGVLLIGMILTTFYTFLGGFKDIAISIQPVKAPLVFASVPYTGYGRSDRLDSLFEQTRQLHHQGKLKGTLGAIYYDMPVAQRKKGEIKALVGIWTTDSTATLPKGFHWEIIPAKQVVQARLQAHFLVSPSPDEVHDDMRVFAEKKGLRLTNFLIEKYLSDEAIILETPVQ